MPLPTINPNRNKETQNKIQMTGRKTRNTENCPHKQRKDFYIFLRFLSANMDNPRCGLTK